MAIALRRLLIGTPLPTERAAHEKLSNFLALPVFASDALSSVAYATGEIMAALLIATSLGVGSADSFRYVFPISIAIVALLAIVTTSYQQTVMAYPGGGGAYIVARDNLGPVPAQIAGAALLIDYILTVAVSVSSGVAAIESLLYATRGVHIPVVPLCLVTVAFITIINLRGVRESGAIFAGPTYAFILSVFTVIGFGIYKMVTGQHPEAHTLQAYQSASTASEHMTWIVRAGMVAVVLHAFASGCTALTGVEAISNGVTAFKQPSARNAARTMLAMAILLGIMFLGLSYLAVWVHALPETASDVHETVISQVGRAILGKNGLYIFLQFATALILALAANTSFADFPRLSALQANDGFLPKQLSNMGDRLVFDRGIITLGVLASILIWRFHGDTHKLIPLYAVGVFLSFTLSQAGMVKRWFRLKSPGWHLKAFVNGLGAVVTCIVLLIFGAVKFVDGAWVVIVLIPILVMFFLRIHAHYASVDKQLETSVDEVYTAPPAKHAVLVLVPGVTRGSLKAIDYARSLAGDCRAIHVEVVPSRTPGLRDAWVRYCDTVPLVILASPFRTVIDPLMEYLDEVQKETPNTQITVVVPEFVPPKWWQGLLHGHTGLMLKLALLGRKNVIVTNVRYHLEDERVTLRTLFEVEDYEGHL